VEGHYPAFRTVSKQWIVLVRSRFFRTPVEQFVQCTSKSCVQGDLACILTGLLLIPLSFDWLAALHLDLLQTNVFIAVYLTAAVFLATCFNYCSRGLPTAIFPGIAPSRMFTTNSLCLRLIICPIYKRRLFL
jgi:hypothetical protein